jgi:hypothetical protein
LAHAAAVLKPELPSSRTLHQVVQSICAGTVGVVSAIGMFWAR